MIEASSIQEHAEVIGADGAHVGTVDRVEGNRIKLTRADSPQGHEGHHHFIDLQMVRSVEQGRVQLSVNASEAKGSQQEQSGRSAN